MIEHLAIATANQIKKMNPDETEPHDVLVFGFTIFYNLATTFTLILLTGFLLGKFSLALQVSISFMILRILTGGAHLERSFACLISSLFLVIGALFLPNSIAAMYMFALAGFIFILLYAPYYAAHQLQHSKKWERKKKRFALIWIGFSLFLFISFGTPGFVQGIFLQGLLLTPLGISMTHQLNQFIMKVVERHEKLS